VTFILAFPAWQLLLSYWSCCDRSYQAYQGLCCQWDTQHPVDLEVRCLEKWTKYIDLQLRGEFLQSLWYLTEFMALWLTAEFVKFVLFTYALSSMAGTRHNIFSSRSCDAMATEPEIPCYVYLFYNFVTGWILEILYLHVRAVLGRSQSNQTITTLTPVLAPLPRAWWTWGSNKTCLLKHSCTRHIVCLGVGPRQAPGSSLPGQSCWQERWLSTAWLGVPQAVNSGTERQIPFLLQNRTTINFIAHMSSGGFYCFPKKQFYHTSQRTRWCPMLLPGRGGERGLEAHTGQETQWECVRSPDKVLRSAPLEAPQLCQPCLSLNQSCQLG